MSVTRVAQRSLASTVRAASLWQDVPMGPPDAILGVSEAFKESFGNIELH